MEYYEITSILRIHVWRCACAFMEKWKARLEFVEAKKISRLKWSREPHVVNRSTISL